MKNNRMKNLWKFVLMISLLLSSCINNNQQEAYKYEDRVFDFLASEKINTTDVCVYFIKNLSCPCVQSSINDLTNYKDKTSKKYIFSNFDVDSIQEVVNVGFDEIFVYESIYYEKFGLNFSTPKIFIIKNNKVVEWKDYQ